METIIIVDSRMAAKLRLDFSSALLCDESAKILGDFIPRRDGEELILEPQISEEELDRRQQRLEPSFTMAEVLAHLEKLR